MSVTYSPKDLFRETEKIYMSMYDSPFKTEGAYLTRVDLLLQKVESDLGITPETLTGSACFVVISRFAELEVALFGETDVIVEDDVTIAHCIEQARRIRKRVTKSSRVCPFY